MNIKIRYYDHEGTRYIVYSSGRVVRADKLPAYVTLIPDKEKEEDK